jgi:hypothetical protein
MDGERVQDIIVHINRLGVAKKRVDKRIATLNGEQFDFVSDRKDPFFFLLVGKKKYKVTLLTRAQNKLEKIHFSIVRSRKS